MCGRGLRERLLLERVNLRGNGCDLTAPPLKKRTKGPEEPVMQK